LDRERHVEDKLVRGISHLERAVAIPHHEAARLVESGMIVPRRSATPDATLRL
jgi:hypothetical protein